MIKLKKSERYKTMKRLLKILSPAILLPALVIGLGLFAQPSYAAEKVGGGPGNGANQTGNVGGQPQELFGEGGIFQTITNVLLFLVGSISVIMLIVGGIRYVVSGGDSTAVQSAKNTILYAIVGIIVALVSFAVVGWINVQFSA